MDAVVDNVLCDTTEGHKTCYIALLLYITLSSICSIINLTQQPRNTQPRHLQRSRNCQINLPFKPLVMIKK